MRILTMHTLLLDKVPYFVHIGYEFPNSSKIIRIETEKIVFLVFIVSLHIKQQKEAKAVR